MAEVKDIIVHIDNFKMELLKKYIRHVHDCEGSDFIDQISDQSEFTHEEVGVLKGLIAQIQLERKHE